MRGPYTLYSIVGESTHWGNYCETAKKSGKENNQKLKKQFSFSSRRLDNGIDDCSKANFNNGCYGKYKGKEALDGSLEVQ